MRQVLQDALLGKEWRSANRNTYMILYVFLLEVCEQWNCSWEMLQYSSRNALHFFFLSKFLHAPITTEWRFPSHVLAQNFKKNNQKKRQAKKNSHIKFKTKANKLSVHGFLKSCSWVWRLSELCYAIKHGQIFFTHDGNLAFYFFGKFIFYFIILYFISWRGF